jgi:hypothetical protein
MEKIFLIYSNDGGFEPQNYVLGYKTSEDEVKAAVEALKVDYHKARAFNDSIHEAYRKFEEENESPLIRQNLIEYQRWPSGIGKDQITQEMRLERNEIIAKNEKTREENSKAYAEWQLKQMEYVKPLINAVANEPWFEKWFDFGERFISCSACGLVEDYEFIYEECEELK